MGNPYSIGRDCQVVLLWNGTRLDLRDVTGFQAQQEVRQQRSDPLNSVPIEFNTPAGWRGQFQVDRGSSALDDLIAAIEAAFWNAGVIGSGTIYQYVSEADGSTSTYEFVGVSLTLTSAGHYQAENIVKQVISFYASQEEPPLMPVPAEIDSGDGRRFALREANPGDMLDLIEAAGAAAGSAAWMRYALMICSVTAIDGKPVMMPVTKEGVRELGRRIGNVGMEALARIHYPDESEMAAQGDRELDTAKN